MDPDVTISYPMKPRSLRNYTITFNNLLNTEIDIVLESPNHLFIGEAKSEMGFSPRSNRVLVHQLVRQYVTARILLAYVNLNCKKSVIPFIVWDKDDEESREVQGPIS